MSTVDRSSLDTSNTAPLVDAATSIHESETDSLNIEVQKFEPEEALPEEHHELSRTPSMLERISTRLSFFNPHLKNERTNLVRQYLTIYLLMFVAILGIFSIYWGSSYRRQTRYPNLKMLVVIEDDESFGGHDPIIGDTIRNILNTPQAQQLGGWKIQNTTEFRQEAEKHNNTVFEEVERQIHHQLYWSSIYVAKNATGQYYDYIMNEDSTTNLSSLIVSVYETGRDFLNMNSYVTPNVAKIGSMWLRSQNNLSELFSDETFNVQQATKLSTPIAFTLDDKRPFTDPVLVAPSQVGLIYIIILTFFQVNLFGEVNQKVAKLNLKPSHFVIYRLLGSYISYFVISLGYSLVTLAFQVDFNKAFGKSGFLVYWMFSYLTMISVGLVNEVMFMVLLMFAPFLVGFWLLFWVLINISPTFAPIALVPKFYRFGYAMPIHNSYELTKVVFFDTYKGQMGRNIGILVAWIVISTIAYVAILKPFGMTMRDRAIKAKQAEMATQEKVAKATAEEAKGQV
ncbi:nitrosoguanidine resistance protein Sng1p [[Candida] jaroonii]|uniref:Nitrosoguanidine resistance protein Sng1p n=1 Tax=[Candida] jaroonii TaxID=467808 RepID=A0ACA9Y5Z2_9ASCO|nr:nitrosoguanidine resistance protein Sng1p [[Candida] jaroonii]